MKKMYKKPNIETAVLPKGTLMQDDLLLSGSNTGPAVAPKRRPGTGDPY